MKYLYFLPITLILLFCVGMMIYKDPGFTLMLFGALIIIMGSIILAGIGMEKFR